MKITCPKCLSAYKVDLPDPGEAGIDVQCGQCHYIFLFSPDIEVFSSSEIQSGSSVKTRDFDLSEDRPSEPMVPPKKDVDRKDSDSKKQASSSSKKDQEISEDLELESHSGDPEPIEIVVEDEIINDSLEEESLDDIWNQAMQEGARATIKSKEQPSSPTSERPILETDNEKTFEETPPPLENKSQPLPSLEDRQREIDQIVLDHQAKQGEFKDLPLDQKDPQQEKIQEEIDIEEQVTINEGEAIPSWEEAFAHQAEVEAGWNKAKERDRIQEEQQLAEAVDQKDLPTEPTSEKTVTTTPQENKQSLVDEIFTEVKGSQEAPKETATTPQPKSKEDPKQDAVDQIFAEAKAQQEQSQEEVDLNEEVVIYEEEDMPSWEDAFTHQAKVEEGWKKAKEQDRIQEEQQLAEALGEEYMPLEPAVSETPTDMENPQAIVDDIFAQMKSQAQSTDQTPAQGTPVSFTADAGTTAEEEYEPTWTDAFDDQSKTEEIWGKPQELEDTGEAATASEEKEIDQPITGDFDLAEDLVNMDMKQLVEQAFKEESEQIAEAPISERVETPTPGEATPEPEISLEMEATQETPAAEQSAPMSQDEEDIEQTIDYYASYVDPPAASEMEPIPELTLESTDADSTAEEEPISELTLESTDADSTAEEEYESVWTDAFADPSEIENTQEKLEEAEADPALEPVAAVTQEEEPEIELELELEPVLESVETPLESETTIVESLEIQPEPTMEAEPELAMESHEATVASEKQSTLSQVPSLDEESKELWDDLLPEHKEEEQRAHEEAPIADFDEGEVEEPFGDSDFWDQVLEKDSQESQTTETPATQEPVSTAAIAQDKAENEALTDEELWQQAFPGEKELEPDASKHFDEEDEDSQSTIPPLVIGANVNMDEESQDYLKDDEAAYSDFDDDDDEFEFQRKKPNLGPFTIPHGRRGDLVIGGAMLVFILLAGSFYFTLQTFAPGELTDIQTAKTEVPEGLSPREVPLDELAGNMTTPKPQKPEQTPIVDTPGDKGEAILSDPAKILEASPEEKGILKDLAESQILKDTGGTQTAKVDESALQPLTGHSVTMSTIMPVAYNPTDIRVLSFSVEIQLSNAQSAKMVRESMPVYEEIVNQAVEDLLRRKFYNDILYVKEKLQKRLQTAMNKSLKNGRVRKAKFIDFAIQ